MKQHRFIKIAEFLAVVVTIVTPIWALVYKQGEDGQTLKYVKAQTELLTDKVDRFQDALYEQRLQSAELETRMAYLEKQKE